MNKVSAFLYRFRGYILGLLAVGVLLCPAFPLYDENARIQLLYIYGACVFYALGIILRVNARKHIGAHSRGKKHEADDLVTSGVYAYMRHPLYCSNTLIIWGAIILHLGFTPMMFFWGCIGFWFELVLAKIEDRFLESRFGDTWRAWAVKTPIFPNLSCLFGNTRKIKSALSGRIPPKRTFMQAFCADWSSWVWFLFFNFLILIRKFI